MKEFLIGVILAAIMVLCFHYHDMRYKIDALQLQINLIFDRIDRNEGCPTGIVVLVPGEDFYHPREVMICQH